MPPCKSSPLFALHPNVVAQTQMRMALCKQVRQQHHAVFQGMDGLVLLQLQNIETNKNKNLKEKKLFNV